jgi:hypothetical protein
MALGCLLLGIANAVFFFSLERKETKVQVSREASLPHMGLGCKAGKTWAGTYCGLVAQGPVHCKSSLCPAAAHGLLRFARFRAKLPD